MARLVEESEDDFPDLATIIRGDVISGRHRTSKSSTKHLQQQGIDSGNGGLSKTNTSKSVTQDKRNFNENVGKFKHRRRVLKQISNNPLLQPLNNQRSADASSLLLRSPKTVPDILMKPKLSTRKTKAPVRQDQELFSEENSSSWSETSSLSDFIVNDSSSLEEVDSDSDVALSVPRPLRSPRKLMRGLRRRKVRSTSEDGPEKDTPPEGPSGFRSRYSDLSEDKSFNSCIPPRPFGIPTKNSRQEFSVAAASSGMDEPGATLSYSPSEIRSSKKIPKETRFGTPPRSPQKMNGGLISPKKLPRIPSTPHRPSMDDFWSQNVINEWNDEYSPRKTPKAGTRLQKRDEGDFEDHPRLSPQNEDPAKGRVGLEVKRNFNRRKQEIAIEFLAELDRTITESKIASMAEATGGVKIIWSNKLNTTAGRAHWKREVIRAKTPPDDGKPGMLSYRHYASIELAEKVIDDENRLLNVVAHEFCHLANFMISGIKNNPHGKEFKMWAAKCSSHFKHRGIEVTTKHSYAIDYKYVWECSNCGLEFKRHSKSIDPARQQCGTCKSKLVQTKPVPRELGKLGNYQMFVKKNMKRVREDNPGSPQKEIMVLMGKLYQDFKAAKLKEAEEPGSREQSVDDTADAVARKLNFLDLTSP